MLNIPEINTSKNVTDRSGEFMGIMGIGGSRRVGSFEEN
jgi:hypothetical protein